MNIVAKKKEEVLQLKERFDALKPFDIAYQNNIESRLSTKLTYNSNAIEGNTLTEAETKIVVEDGISISGKKMVELYEARNHAKALEYVLSLSQSIGIKDIDETVICDIHTIILTMIDDDNAWVYRNVPVRISGSQSVMPNYAKVPSLMQDLCHWIQTTEQDVIDIACDLHVKFVSIHPFVDGNGRTARLLFNLVLLIGGYPLAIVEMKQRKEYLDVLEQIQTWWSADPYYLLMYQVIQHSLQIYLSDVG